jgi:pimeloyl-ACP methyl ester carboxylesterase
MKRIVQSWLTLFFIMQCALANAQTAEKVVDIPTRSGVSQRMLVLTPAMPKAAVILFTGGNGGLQISPDGMLRSGKTNFLIRNRQSFASRDLMVLVVDAPSDRQSPPYLAGFRQTQQHVSDIQTVIAWIHGQTKIPVWLIGTSRGTQSAAFVATQLNAPDGLDGLVLTSTIVTDDTGIAVPAMQLENIRIPVLVVHHEQDGCKHCAFAGVTAMMEKFSAAPKKQLLSFTGGSSSGNPCEPLSYHGFNGLDADVVGQIADWIFAK